MISTYINMVMELAIIIFQTIILFKLRGTAKEIKKTKDVIRMRENRASSQSAFL